MLGDLAILVKAEDVKGDLLTGTGAVCQIVLDVAIRQQAAGGVRIAGGKGVDERQRLFGLALFLLDRRRLLGVFSGCLGSSVL